LQLHHHLVRLPGDVEIEFRFSGEEFPGLGGIKIGGLPVRDDAWPICQRFETLMSLSAFLELAARHRQVLPDGLPA
jgi:hypothetical protein